METVAKIGTLFAVRPLIKKQHFSTGDRLRCHSDVASSRLSEPLYTTVCVSRRPRAHSAMRVHPAAFASLSKSTSQ